MQNRFFHGWRVMTISCSVGCTVNTAPDDFFSAVDVPSHALVGAATFAAEQAFRKCILAVISAAFFLIGIKWKTWKQTENCREKQKIPAANGKLAAGKLKTFWKQQKKVEIFAEKLQNRAAGEGKLAPKRPTKKSNRLKTVGHLYKTHLENRSSTSLILCDATKKRACDILYVTGSWCGWRDLNPHSFKGTRTWI